jgi:hypothetical protein
VWRGHRFRKGSRVLIDVYVTNHDPPLHYDVPPQDLTIDLMRIPPFLRAASSSRTWRGAAGRGLPTRLETFTLRTRPSLVHDVKAWVVGFVVALASVAVMATAAAAQPRARNLPSIGLPLPCIGLPHPPMGLPPLESAGTQPAQGAPGPVPGPRRGGRWQRGAFAPVVLLPPYYWYLPAPTAGMSEGNRAAPPREAPRQAAGTLWLDVTPAVPMQVFVDGYYIGTTDELGTGLELEAGPRQLELRAPGYAPLTFGARIDANRTLTYRETLRRRDDAAASAASPSVPTPAPPAAPAVPMTLYVIPGCYAGNVRPTAAMLPAGCDLSDVRQLR